MAAFGELLAELRRDRGLRQEDLANKLYMSPSTISNYETGVQFPPVGRLKEIADFFDVTTDYLLGRCSVSVSPDMLEAQLLPGRTAGMVIQEIGHLSPERKLALSVILDDMRKLSTILGEVQ